VRNLSLQFLLITIGFFSPILMAQEWRTEPLSEIDRNYMSKQHESIDDLARRNFGRQLNGDKYNDFAVMQRLLDEGLVKPSQVKELQAMGIILGELLKSEYNLNWVVYIDRYGRSRSLQVPGINKEFIFPATQLSRKAEVGIKVQVADVYKVLEQAVVDIRNKPPF
jgi:hypothetical protein